jgi:iron(III) transport system permease protein
MRLGPSRPSIETGDGRATRPWPPAFIVPAIGLLLGGLVLVPMGALIRAALTRTGWMHLDLGAALLTSLATAALATVLAAITAIALAAVLATRDQPGASVLRWAITATLLVPSFAFAIGWRAIAPGAPPLALLVLALAAAGIAPIFLAAHWALAQGGPDTDDDAQMFGIPATARSIAQLRSAGPVLTAASLLTFARALTDLGAPLLLTAPSGTPLLTTEILRAYERAPGGATAPAAALLLCACLALLLTSASQINRAAPRTGDAELAGSPASLGEMGPWRWPAFALALALVFGLLGFPFAALLSKALAAFQANTIAKPLSATITIAMPAAALALVLAGAAAILSHKPQARSASLLTTLCLLPAAIPGLALALGIAAGLAGWFTNTSLLLMLAIAAVSLPAVLHHVREGLSRMPADQENAARMHGADRRAVFRGIILPQLTPRLIGAWGLIFASACREVPASLLLAAPGARTLVAESLDGARTGNFDHAAMLAIVAIALSASVVAIASRISGVPLLAPGR